MNAVLLTLALVLSQVCADGQCHKAKRNCIFQGRIEIGHHHRQLHKQFCGACRCSPCQCGHAPVCPDPVEPEPECEFEEIEICLVPPRAPDYSIKTAGCTKHYWFIDRTIRPDLLIERTVFPGQSLYGKAKCIFVNAETVDAISDEAPEPEPEEI